MTTNTNTTVVLVHAGFVDGSGCRGVYDELRADGIVVGSCRTPASPCRWRCALGLDALDALDGTITEAAWRSKPSWYIRVTKDRMIPPAAQASMAARINATVVATPVSHAIYVSQPKVVAKKATSQTNQQRTAKQERRSRQAAAVKCGSVRSVRSH